MEMSQTKISWYGYFGGEPKDSNLLWCLTTDRYKKQVEAIRSLSDADLRTKKKKQLPGFTPSGLFAERKARGLIQHSGYICLDIDGKDNPHITDWQMFLHDVGSKYPFIAYAGLSVSGRGAFLIVPIKHTERHTQHFDSLVAELAPDVVVDKSGRDVSRYRFMSYNADPFINEAAEVYGKYIEPVKAVRREYAGAGDGVQMLYDAVMNSGVNITQDYRDWLTLACSLRNVPGGREMFHDLSSMDSRYSREQCDEQFDAVQGGSGITVSSFFWLAKKHGIQIKKY
jgi:hypothetical protein